jgi:hypothetical protein
VFVAFVLSLIELAGKSPATKNVSRVIGWTQLSMATVWARVDLSCC